MQPTKFDSLSKEYGSDRGDSLLSLRDIFNVIFCHKLKIIVFFIVTVTTVTILTLLADKIYESRAKILIKLGRENTSQDPTMMGPTVKVSQEFSNFMNNELKIIKSRYVVERVIDKFGVEKLVGRGVKRAVAIKSVMDNLSVAVEKESNIVKLGYQSKDPELAQETLNSVMDIFMDRHIEIHRIQASPSFFHKQSEKLLEELKQKESKLRQFSTEHGIALLGEQKRVLLDQISVQENVISSASGQISSSQSKIVSLTESLKGLSPTTEISRVKGNDAALGEIKVTLNELQLKETDLKNRYPDDSRELKDLREQIKFALLRYVAERESDKNVAVTRGIDTNYKTLQLDLERERANLKSLVSMKQTTEEELEAKKAELAALSTHEMALARLRDEVDIARKGYREYRESLHRANISAALDVNRVSNISIIQEATLPTDHIRPRKRVNVALSIVFGLFGGIGLAYFLEYINDSLKSVEDITKRLELPVLATVPLK